jgi:hypothetical protein
MECRNPEAMDGKARLHGIPAAWMPAIPAGMTVALNQLLSCSIQAHKWMALL